MFICRVLCCMVGFRFRHFQWMLGFCPFQLISHKWNFENNVTCTIYCFNMPVYNNILGMCYILYCLLENALKTIAVW